MDRRRLLSAAAGLPALTGAAALAAPAPAAKVRPGQPGWPSDQDWERFGKGLQGELIRVRSPLETCKANAGACEQLFKAIKNPYYLGDEPGLTQTLGWVDAWTSKPSVYAVAAQSTADVVKAVNFARERRLRLVVRGGGHSYIGTSNAPDSLMIWTRRMQAISMHDAFVPAGCVGKVKAEPAASVGSGCYWRQVYETVGVKGGRYVQGGGCFTVGVAGLVQGGGFGSFSKMYGTAAASLLEAEVVTADGQVRIANECTHPDLYWALKGGGGGTWGVITRLTLKTHQFTDTVGAVLGDIRANSDEAYRRLIGRVLDFYAGSLFNWNWGEQLSFHGPNTLSITMLFAALGEDQVRAIWKPFFDWVAASPQDYKLSNQIVLALPPRDFWNPEKLKQLPGVVRTDPRPGAPASNIFWASNYGEAGEVLNAYQSVWMPQALLGAGQRARLADTLFAASRHWGFALHTNKGLAGAPPEAIAAARNTATNPAVLDAFALLISASDADPAYPGVPGHEPDVARGRTNAARVEASMAEIRKLVPHAGSYVNETDYFQKDWQDAFWGPNYRRLAAIKRKYDPDGLFYAHHGVGSEAWSEDGFSRRG